MTIRKPRPPERAGASSVFEAIVQVEAKHIGRTPDYMIAELIRITTNLGIDPEVLLAEAGIDSDDLSVASPEVEREKISRYIYTLWKRLGDEGAGLSGAPIPLGAYYMMGRLTVGQPTLRKALTLGFRFYDMVTKAYSAKLTEEDGAALLEFDLLPVPPSRDPYHIFTELLLMAWHRYSCFLVGQHIPLIDIHFTYDIPVHVCSYSSLFPGNHVFNSARLGFSFPASYLDQEIVQNDDSVKKFMNESPMSFIKRYHGDGSMAGKIIRFLRPLVRIGLPNIEGVAETLNLTKRTLNRKLKAECTSYQRLKDIVRRDEAISLLVENKIAINEISEIIQFSEPAVFSRAFLGWTGESPGQFRDKVNRAHGKMHAATVPYSTVSLLKPKNTFKD